MAVDAMREGAYDFLAKPYATERLLGSIRHALDKRRLVLENRALRRRPKPLPTTASLIGSDRGHRAAAPYDPPDRRHRRRRAGRRRDRQRQGGGGERPAQLEQAPDRPFVAVNCGALPETMIESELFGHEPGAFTGALKKRIGRIEHAQRRHAVPRRDRSDAAGAAGEAAARARNAARSRRSAPTTSAPSTSVSSPRPRSICGDPAKRGDFREDLYYRLNVVTVSDPAAAANAGRHPAAVRPLPRPRRQAVWPRASPIDHRERHFLLEHSWPGNIRELAHYAERVALGLNGDAPAPGSEFSPLPKRVEA